MFFPILLDLHNILRWVVVISGLIAITYQIIGWTKKKPWTKADTLWTRIYAHSMEVQILIGLILYFISPFNQVALQNFGAAMKNTEMRFYAVEHIFAMIFAVGMIHAGRVLARKAKDDWKKHRSAALFYILAMVVILGMVPWARRLLPF